MIHFITSVYILIQYLGNSRLNTSIAIAEISVQLKCINKLIALVFHRCCVKHVLPNLTCQNDPMLGSGFQSKTPSIKELFEVQ